MMLNDQLVQLLSKLLPEGRHVLSVRKTVFSGPGHASNPDASLMTMEDRLNQVFWKDAQFFDRLDWPRPARGLGSGLLELCFCLIILS